MTQTNNLKDIPASYRNKGNLREGDLKKHLTRLTLPMIWGIAVIISFQLVDMYFISRLGTDELAAISFTFPVTYGILSITIGFGIAVSSVISRLIGEGGQDKLKRVTTHGLLLVFGVCCFIALTGLLIHEALFSAMGADGDLLALIKDYMLIWFAAIALISMPLVGNSAIRANGDAMTPAAIMTVAAVINTILDPILIFGLFGFPRMEIQGAALATVIGNGCAFFAILYVLRFKKEMVDFKWLHNFTNFGETAKNILIIAIPVGMAQAIQPFVNAIIISLLAAVSAEAVAAYGVVTRVEAFVFIVLMALATGMAPIIGQNFGAALYDRVRATMKLVISFTVIWSALIAVMLAVAGRQIAGLFTGNENIIEVVYLYFLIVPVSYLFSHLVNGWSSAFNAMGQPKKSFTMIVVKMLVVMLPAVYIGAQFGIKGIFIAIALVNFVIGSTFHTYSWKSMVRDFESKKAAS